MASVWTQGVWTVKAGREAEFVQGWQELARVAASETDVVSQPILLRDVGAPNVFLAFGAWASLDELARFRALPSVQAGASALDGLVESGEARVLTEVGVDE